MNDTLVTQVIALSWFRCLMEEGYDFINKVTGDVETNEINIFRNFEQNTGAFDLPTAKCSPRGLEKNLLEVIGNLVVYNSNQVVKETVSSTEFINAIKQHIEKIRAREYSGKVPQARNWSN
jgi:hypothetical protein